MKISDETKETLAYKFHITMNALSEPNTDTGSIIEYYIEKNHLVSHQTKGGKACLLFSDGSAAIVEKAGKGEGINLSVLPPSIITNVLLGTFPFTGIANCGRMKI